MLPCNFTSENYILIIVFKYNNYDRGMLSGFICSNGNA